MAGGAIARKIIPDVIIRGALVQIGPHKVNRADWDWQEVENNGFFCPDSKTAAVWADYIGKI